MRSDSFVTNEQHPAEPLLIGSSGICLVCNRPLRDPESLRLGVGPICRKKHPAALTQGRLFEQTSGPA